MTDTTSTPSEKDEAQFEALLQFLQQNRGFDFTGYKRPSLMRRMARRMQMVGAPTFADYQDYLQVHPEEFAQLFNTLLINVTSFFRDPPAWDFLRRQVLAPLIASKASQEPVRVWSAGCASGEEAYSIAILLAEEMGDDAYRERVKIYATDLDDEALNHARLASYGPKEMEGVEAPRRERYFEPLTARYVVRGDLRRGVIFGRHDLVQDAPISRLDLVICRNVLMYFTAETQAKVLQRFHFAVNGEPSGQGYLFLGRAEMMLSHGNLFTPRDLKFRVFAKVASPGARRLTVAAIAATNGEGTPMTERNGRLRDAALEELPLARMVVDSDGILVLANQRARTLFSLSPKDIGRPLSDLEVSHRPIELRPLIEQANAARRSVTQASVERRFNGGEAQYFDVVVAPYYDEANHSLGVGITFLDVTRSQRLQEELSHSHEELQTTNEELQSSNEELETTNEELQSSNEELETTNEELQSTNEELETMNEELQSTNEELQTVNEELRQRSEELNHVNAFLESVLTGLRSAAVVVNQNLDILVWNHRAEDIWGLRADEVQGRSFLNLDIGLPVTELRPLIRACLADDAGAHNDVMLDAVNRRGKKIKCRVVCTPLFTATKKREGVILLMDEVG